MNLLSRQVIVFFVIYFAVGVLNAQDSVRDIDVRAGGSISGFVSEESPNDWYKFTLSVDGTLTLGISGLVADADLCLYDGSVNRTSAENKQCHFTSPGEHGLLDKSSGRGTTADMVEWPLGPGTYYIRVDYFPLSTPGGTEYLLTYQLAEPPELRLSPMDFAIDEGSTGTYAAVLTRRPSGQVSVNVVSNDSSAVSIVSPPRLSFTPENWASPQTVIVRAEEDDDADDERVSISNRVTGLLLGGSVTTEDVTVTVRDNDSDGVTVTPTTVAVDEGATGSYTVVLTSNPDRGRDGLTVTVTPRPDPDNADVTFTPTSLSFTADNWSTEQRVTVSAADDPDALDESATITHEVSGYGNVTSADAVTVTVRDDDIAATTAPGSPRDLHADESEFHSRQLVGDRERCG